MDKSGCPICFNLYLWKKMHPGNPIPEVLPPPILAGSASTALASCTMMGIFSFVSTDQQVAPGLYQKGNLEGSFPLSVWLGMSLPKAGTSSYPAAPWAGPKLNWFIQVRIIPVPVCRISATQYSKVLLVRRKGSARVSLSSQFRAG